MKAAVLHAVGKLTVEEMPEPVPGAGEVVVRVGAAGYVDAKRLVTHTFPLDQIGEAFAANESLVGMKVIVEP